jgi:hypothetical protein
MARIDDTKPFLPVNIAVLTVSDTRTEADDKSGRTLAELIVRDGHRVAARAIVRDDIADIIAQLKAWIADGAIDVVISTGGTGVTGPGTPSLPPSLREGDRGLRRAVPHAQLREGQDLDHPEPGHRRGGRRHLSLRPARLARRLPRRLGRNPRASARFSPPALQLRRNPAAIGRTPEAGESEEISAREFRSID